MLDVAPEAAPARREPAATSRVRPLRLALFAAGVAGGALLLVALFPVVSGAPWADVVTTIRAVPTAALVALVALWAAGLLAHTTTLSAALPGLSRRRALLLSLTGSAVSNVLPLGGAAGVALNYRMTRRWGFTPASFATYTVVTNLWDVTTKLVLPVLAVPLLLRGLPVGPGVSRALTAAALVLPVFAALASLLVRHPRLLGRIGPRVERVRAQVADVVGSSWRRLTAGMTLYTLLLFALLACCLAVTGAGVGLGVVLVAFCVERLATLVGLTPGGLGLVEVGLAGALMLAPGADASGVAAGTLLYRALTFGLEIPVGALLLAGWTWRSRVAS